VVSTLVKMLPMGPSRAEAWDTDFFETSEIDEYIYLVYRGFETVFFC
jgi:hypothetical protein